MKAFFLLIQLIGFFAAIAFAGGGGNYPEAEAGSFIYLKALLMLFPIALFSVVFLYRPQATLNISFELIKKNKWLCLFFLSLLISLPLAVDPSYSLLRLIYTYFCLCSLFAVTAQYFILLEKKEQREQTFVRHMAFLSFVSLLLPAYTLMTQPVMPLVPGFRSAIQSLMLIHPNLLASFYAQLFLWHVFRYVYAPQGRNIVNLVLSLVFLVLVFTLFSRAILISLTVTAYLSSILSYLWYKNRHGLVLFLSISMFILLAALLLTIGMIDTDTIKQFLVRAGDPDTILTLTNRTTLWSRLLSELSLKVFFVGNGYSVMTESFGMDFGTGILYGAHNAYLSVFLGSGIFCLSLILIYFFKALSTLYAARMQLSVFSVMVITGSHSLLLLSALASEEFGVNLTVTFGYLVLTTNILMDDTRMAVTS
jgi:hypothetical protein